MIIHDLRMTDPLYISPKDFHHHKDHSQRSWVREWTLKELRVFRIRGTIPDTIQKAFRFLRIILSWVVDKSHSNFPQCHVTKEVTIVWNFDKRVAGALGIFIFRIYYHMFSDLISVKLHKGNDR